MIEIRRAKHEDLNRVLELGREFFGESPFAGLAPWDDDSFVTTIAAFLSEAVEGSLLVAQRADGSIVGMAGAVIFPLYFNMNFRMAQEIFWFVQPDERKGAGTALLDALEVETRKMGADVFMSASLAGKRDKALDRVYQRRGYTPAENIYMRRLSS
jgi:GNAT superfamily N-acetyltransferase